MASLLTVIRSEFIGVNLPDFLLSKSGCPDPVRAPSIPLRIFQIAPENKKPGVERRAKPPH